MRPKVSLYRTPRTGSTAAKRCLAIVADSPPGECTHETFTASAPLMVTIRDWRDVVYSHWRIRYAPAEPTIAQVRCAMGATDKRLTKLMRTEAASGGYRWSWRYEDLWNNPVAVVKLLERIAERTLDLTESIAVEHIVLVDNAKAIADAITHATDKPFNAWDKKTGIHGGHVSPHRGKPGAWRDVFPTDFHEELTTHYSEALKYWGYDQEDTP